MDLSKSFIMVTVVGIVVLGDVPTPAKQTALVSTPQHSELLALLKSGKRVMYVGAHPDDECMAGPLLARAAEQTHVLVVCFTRGEGGMNLLDDKRDAALGKIREKELAACCEALGVEHCVLGFWNGLPGGFRNPDSRKETREQAIARWSQSGKDPKAELVKVVRQWQPDVVVTVDPIQGFTGHREHCAAALLATAAFTDAANAAKFPEQLQGGLKVWEPQWLYYMVNPTPEHPLIHRIDRQRISETIDGNVRSPKWGKTYVEIATEAMARYESQVDRTKFLAGPAGAHYAKQVGQTALVLAENVVKDSQLLGAAEPVSVSELTTKTTKKTDKATYWFSPAPPLNKQTLSFYRDLAKQEWLKRFESLPAIVPPPTWPDWDTEFEKGLADLTSTLGAKLCVSSFTVGKRGWETSTTEKLPPRFPFRPDLNKNMEPTAWFKKLATVSQPQHLGVSIEMLNRGAQARFPDLAAEFTTNIMESAKGQPAGGTFALWLTLAFEEFGGSEPIVRTVKNIRDKVDYIAWMDTRLLFEKHGMELCRRRVRELVELCGRDKIVIQVGVHSTELAPYPKEFMAMCREEGVGIYFLYVSKPVLDSSKWKEFVQELP